MKLHPSPGRSATLSALFMALAGPLCRDDVPASEATIEEMARAIRRPVEMVPGLLTDLVDLGLLWQTRRCPGPNIETRSYAIAQEPGAGKYVIDQAFEHIQDVLRVTREGLLANGWNHIEAEAEVARFGEGPEFVGMYEAIDTFVDFCVQHNYQ